jgi:hypothetical protein
MRFLKPAGEIPAYSLTIKDGMVFNIPVKKVYNAGMNEETLSEMKLENGKIAVEVAPFRVITLKLGV